MPCDAPDPCSAEASGVRAWRCLMWEPSSHLALSFLLPGGSAGFVALLLLWESGGCPIIHPRLPAGSYSWVLGGLTLGHRVSPVGRREVCGEGSVRLCGLAGSKRGKEKGFWVRSPWMTCGKTQVTAKLPGSKQQSPGRRTWGSSDSGESFMGLWANQPIGCSKRHVTEDSTHEPSPPFKVFLEECCKTPNQPCMVLLHCKGNRYSHNASYGNSALPPAEVRRVFLLLWSSHLSKHICWHSGACGAS